MSLSNSTLSIQPLFDYDNKSFAIKDTYDYVAESIALADLESLAKVTSPAGDVILDGLTAPDWDDPLIDLDVSDTSAYKTLTGSLDDDTGDILEGDYIIDYRLRRKFAAVQILTTTSFVLTGEFDNVDIPIGSIIDLEGWTNASNNKSVTVVSVTPGGGFTGVGVVETLITETTAAFAYVRFEKQFTLCYEFGETDIVISHSHSCKNSRLSVSDETIYNEADTLISRLWTIKSPVKANGQNVVPDVTSAVAYVNIKPIYTGAYSISLQVTLTRLLDSGILVSYVAGDVVSHEVTCSKGLAQRYACIKAALYKISCGCGGVSPLVKCKVDELQNELLLANLADAAGNQDDLNYHLEKIDAILESLDCDCSIVSDGEPVLVVSSVYSIQLAAANVTYDNSVTGSIYTNAQALFDYLLSIPQAGGVVEVRRGEYSHPTEVAPYETSAEYDLASNFDALEIEFDYDSNNASGALGVKLDGVDSGLVCLIGVNTGRARLFVTRKNANIQLNMVATEPGITVLSGFISLPFGDTVSIAPYWASQPGAGNIRCVVVTRITGADIF